MSDRSYVIGPTLGPTENPWPILWEQDPKIDNGHGHIWELCLLKPDGRHRVRLEEVVRCMVCYAPRCGHSTDEDPCIERRHHRGPHLYSSGRVERVGA